MENAEQVPLMQVPLMQVPLMQVPLIQGPFDACIMRVLNAQDDVVGLQENMLSS